jgi:hypothetical protein
MRCGEYRFVSSSRAFRTTVSLVARPPPYPCLTGVYDISALRRYFQDFDLGRAHKEFMHAPPLPVHGAARSPLEDWYLWVESEVKPLAEFDSWSALDLWRCAHIWAA